MFRFIIWISCIFGLLWPHLVEARRDLNLGVAYTSRSGMAVRVLNGFNQQMRSKGIRVQMTYRTELKSIEALAQVVKAFERTQDGILIMRSTGASWLINHPASIPTFIGACNHPGKLGVIKNIIAPAGNITGVSYYLPRKIQWEIFRAILPDADSVYLLLEKGHPSSIVDLNETKEICRELGISLHYKICETLAEVMEVIQKHRNKVSAFILGTQALYIDNTDKLVAMFPNEIFLSYSGKQVENGALGGFVADDYLLGRKLANAVIDILVEGKPFNEVPVQFDRRPKFLLNVETAERLGIEIPYEILLAATLIGEDKALSQ